MTILLIASIVALIISHLSAKRYSKTLRRMEGPWRPDRAKPDDDLHLVLITLLFGVAGGVGLVFSIIFFFMNS